MPRSLVEELSLPAARRVRASTFRGESVEARLHRADVDAAGQRLTDVEWLPISRPYALLGRNVLNALALRLDGPRLESEVLLRRKRAR